MAYCEKCGTQIQDGIKVCPSCGASAQIQAQINDIEAHKILAVIGYIGILVVVPLISGKYKNSPFLKFHTNQSVVLCIGYVVSALVCIIPYIGALIGGVLSTAILVLQVICIVNAVKGEMTSLPIINEIKIIK